ncbi:MAG: DUF86 domain-containing protein [Chitinophagales bacterium]
MPSKWELQQLLEDILQASQKILSYTSGISKEDFLKDDQIIDAVTRNFEIISEAASRVPENFRIIHREVEWRRMIGFRNRVIHESFGIDYEMVWKIKEENISELIEFIRQAMDDLTKQPE